MMHFLLSHLFSVALSFHHFDSLYFYFNYKFIFHFDTGSIYFLPVVLTRYLFDPLYFFSRHLLIKQPQSLTQRYRVLFSFGYLFNIFSRQYSIYCLRKCRVLPLIPCPIL